MALALDELVRRTLLPDGLADPSHPLARGAVPADELVPGGDDARRVCTDVRHVGEEDSGSLLAERDLKHLDLFERLHDQHGFTGSHAVPDERYRAGDELGPARVEEGLVPELFQVRSG